MRCRQLAACLCFNILIFFALTAGLTYAQGIIVPRPCETCPRPPRPAQLPPALPIKSIKLDTRISAQVATTHVEQIFRNDSDATLEGTYFFPIPETASISEFAIWDGDRRLVGEVRSREEARRIYDEIVRRQRDPGLLEYAGKDLFQASIFPIPPRSDKKLELTYTQVLRAQSGTVSYRYPLGTNHNLASIGRVSGALEIEGNKPLRNIYSPSHAVDVRPSQGGQRARVSFETTGAGREQQDFQLFYTVSSEDFGLSLLTHREPGKDGYFLLMISPKDNWAESEYTAKDIVFVIDTSGSMAEEGKMEKARAAMLFGVKTLRPEDRFNVISFAGEEHLMEGGLIQADERGRARGIEFVQKLRPTGGTNINGALQAALKQFDASERPKLLVFMTDGLPTVGVTNPQNIVDNARAARAGNTRVFTFGVGYDVNTALLDKVASENGGTSDYVEPKEDLELKVSNFFAKVSYPVLTDLALDMGGVETDLIYPRAMPDLFRGAQVTLIGRYRNPNDLRDVRLRLSGRSARERRSFAYENLRFPANSDENDFLPRLWATRRVGWLMEQIRSNGEARELRDEVVDLGTRYGIVTPYTSYLALEPGAVATQDAVTITSDGRARNVSPSGRRVTSRRAGNLPGKTRTSSAGGTGSGGNVASAPMAEVMPMPTPAPTPLPAPMPTTGAAAVKDSKRERALKESLRADEDEESAATASGVMRKVAGKTFYLRDDVWTDADFKEGASLPETKLVFGSDAYFELLKRERKLAEFFALGERVVVVFKGHVYRVNAAP
ncbi:MAG TPA: VIT and VWA domain-containing protein [Pyrinomonadaceae bacterium]|nr:VIT and VWA domain-containing protein [Pyrinomonadaceae bacterium]